MGKKPELAIARKKIQVDAFIDLKGIQVPLKTVRHGAAKSYILRIHRDGYIQVTLPKYGTRKEAMAFVTKHVDWLHEQWQSRRTALQAKEEDRHAPWVQFLGKQESVDVRDIEGQTHILFADQSFPVDLKRLDLKEWLDAWLRYLASETLPGRVRQLALRHDFRYKKVVVRNQRTRWGSCSSNKTISLNWRLIQIPPKHCDYIILHELNHLRHMDHSDRFWKSLAVLCPWCDESESWLKHQGKLLRD